MTLAGLAWGLTSCGEASSRGKAAPRPDATRAAKRTTDAAATKATPDATAAVREVVASTAEALESAGERVQRGVVAWLGGDDAGGGWRTAALTRGVLGTCTVDAVGVERRLESATDVVIEAIVGFASPSERGRVLVWASLDDQGRASGLYATGDPVWAARCQKACDTGHDDCPAPRLRPVPESPTEPAVVTGGGERGAALAKAYTEILSISSTTGGFGTLIAPDATFEDVTSGRQRRGVDGFVEAVRALERRFPKARSVVNLQTAAFGAHLVVRFTFVGTDDAGKVTRLDAIDVTRFDRRGRLVASRGYASALKP